jgi:hypothetical protein
LAGKIKIEVEVEIEIEIEIEVKVKVKRMGEEMMVCGSNWQAFGI